MRLLCGSGRLERRAVVGTRSDIANRIPPSQTGHLSQCKNAAADSKRSERPSTVSVYYGVPLEEVIADLNSQRLSVFAAGGFKELKGSKWYWNTCCSLAWTLLSRPSARSMELRQAPAPLGDFLGGRGCTGLPEVP